MKAVHLALAALFFLSCVADEGAVNREEAPLLNSAGFETDRNAIGLLRFEGEPGAWYSCTATLIAPNVAVTAAHCVTDNETDEVYQGRGYFWPGEGEYSDAERRERVYAVHAHPEYTNDNVEVADIAIIELSNPIEEAYIPPSDTAPSDGDPLTIVGFGCYDEWNGQSDGRKRIGPSRVEDVAATLIELDNDSDFARLCPGDSGGPVLADFGGGEVIVGINSHRYSGAFSSHDNVARVDAYMGWAEEVLAAPTPIPRPEIRSIDTVPGVVRYEVIVELADSVASELTLTSPFDEVFEPDEVVGNRVTFRFFPPLSEETWRLTVTHIESEARTTAEVVLPLYQEPPDDGNDGDDDIPAPPPEEGDVEGSRDAGGCRATSGGGYGSTALILLALVCLRRRRS